MVSSLMVKIVSLVVHCMGTKSSDVAAASSGLEGIRGSTGPMSIVGRMDTSTTTAAPTGDANLYGSRRLEDGPSNWLKAGEGRTRLCAGAKADCNSIQTCTYHAYGPCGGAAEPYFYFESQIEAFGLVSDSEAYLTDASQATLMTPSSVANNGYRVVDPDVSTPGGSSYAFITSGAWFGSDPNVRGAYLGMASYVVKSGNIESNTNEVVGPAGVGSAEFTSQKVCISDLESGVCGGPRTFREGSFKFSLFGITKGSQYGGVPGKTHIACRTKLSLVPGRLAGLGATVAFNGNVTLDNIGAADVTTLTLTANGNSGRQMTISFPQTYNVGDATPQGFETPTATKNVKVKVSRVPNENGAIYVDYLFEMISEPNVYFIYDPDVLEATPSEISEILTPTSSAPSAEATTEAPTEAPTAEATTEAPTAEATTEAPTAEATTELATTAGAADTEATTGAPTEVEETSSAESKGVFMLFPLAVCLGVFRRS